MSQHDKTFNTFRQLIATAEPPELGPQHRAGTKSVDELTRVLAEFFAAQKISDAIQPHLRSAALLWHDHLDASHTISQDISSRNGSWLHGIMHRREPDYGNAKYWFRRVGQHDAFPKLAERVATFLHHDGGGLTERLIENGEWMPFGFVDECERACSRGDAQLKQTLRAIQAIEFDTLIEHILGAHS
jgi:hypothetical protein